ncbi:PQQ-dependent sugar dehydrogenase [Microbacterium sp. PA5]|uniref:PQQ-dependent sugar dehydrogenase n=1 Tax=Microbacterium sp. PA5 TaxID=3416654 RepID=UPI003CEE566C
MRRADAGPATTTTALLAGALLLSGCGAEPSSPAPTSPASASPAPASASPTPTPTASPVALPEEAETFASGLDAPWSIAWTADGTPLVSERDTGRILELDAEGDAREVGVVAGVNHGTEGGLLGLAVHEGDLFVYFTADDGNRVVRYDLRGTAGSLALGERTTILEELPYSPVHNAGRIAFGPDGKLYVPVGDARNPSAAQDPDVRRGKILRVEADGSVPADNPTPGSPVYSLGHRNVQGLVWDADGTLYASEFGQNAWDELNVIEPGGNYGWPLVEGTGGEGRGFIDPIATWPTEDASPSGIALAGDTLLIANLRGEVLRAVSTADPGVQREYYAGELGRLRDVAIGPDGAVWFLTNNTDGRGDPREGDDRILRVDPASVTAD